MTNKQHYMVCIFFFILGVVLCYTYRPYIYRNHIFDYHLADTIGNLVAGPAVISFFCIRRKNKSLLNNTLSAIAFLIFYECFLSHFDFMDIVATFISCGITYFVFRAIMKKDKINVMDKSVLNN